MRFGNPTKWTEGHKVEEAPFSRAPRAHARVGMRTLGSFAQGRSGNWPRDGERQPFSLPFRLALSSHFAIGAAVRDDPAAAAGSSRRNEAQDRRNFY